MAQWWARRRLALAVWVAVVAVLTLVAAIAALGVVARPADYSSAVINPVVPHGQDPSVVYTHGAYYLAQSDGARIWIARSPTLGGLGRSARTTVWETRCCDIWAPELEQLGGRWYIYYAATNGDPTSRRMYVLQSAGDDPLGPYTWRGKIAATTDRWAIDGTVLRLGGALYFIWSGWPAATDTGQQNLYIARMRDPVSLATDRALLSVASERWETARVGPHARVEEGPEVLQHAGRTFVIFSANGSWTDDYCLGMLTYTGGSAMSMGAWQKSAGCVFASSPSAGVYGPGHNAFAQSPDGKQDWLIYHANARPGLGWAGRSIRMQPFGWNADGTPRFGTPVPTGRVIKASGGAMPAP